MPEWMMELLASQQITLPLWLPAAVLGLTVVLLIWITVLLFSARRRKKAAARLVRPSEPVTAIHVGKLHDQGAREYQQDNFGISDERTFSTTGLLAVVADGMGGLADGDRVSAALALDENDAPEALHKAIQKKAFSDQDNYTAVILTCKTGQCASKRKGETE